MWRPSWRPSFDRTVSLFLGLVMVSLVMITVDLRASGSGFGGAARDAVQVVFRPIQEAFNAVTDPIVGFVEGISDLVGLRSENERLRDEVAALERELAETESLQAQGGLVGRVVSVTENEARIRLISDPTVRVAIRVERTGETGVLTGRGSGALVLEMFNTDARLEAGDRLVTADGRFPAGIPVATILEDAEAEVGFSLRTTAVSTAELSRIDFVLILIFTRDDTTSDDLADLEDEPVEIPIETTSTTEGP